jgi:hypothetical protein
MKQQFGSDRDNKFVSNAGRIKWQPVIFCGYWLLNEVLGDYVKWKRIVKCTVKALFPHSVEGRGRSTSSRTAAGGPTKVRTGDNCFAKLLGEILVNNQLDALFSMYLFTYLLYMFRATQCSSSGAWNCINTSSGICHSV